MTFLDELKRRNVHRVGAAYLVAAWLLMQVAATLFPAFGLGDFAVRVVVIALAIGIVPALVVAWIFEITPEGFKLEKDVDRSRSITPQTGKRLDRAIMLVLALALGYFALDKFVLSGSREASIAEAAREEGRTEALVKSYGDKSIAVLPFVDMSADKDQEYFSDGISEELLNLLAKIPELRVISRSSAFSYKGREINLARVARELNVAHVLEGSVRKSGNRVRITAQLVEDDALVVDVVVAVGADATRDPVEREALTCASPPPNTLMPPLRWPTSGSPSGGENNETNHAAHTRTRSQPTLMRCEV